MSNDDIEQAKTEVNAILSKYKEKLFFPFDGSEIIAVHEKSKVDEYNKKCRKLQKTLNKIDPIGSEFERLKTLNVGDNRNAFRSCRSILNSVKKELSDL